MYISKRVLYGFVLSVSSLCDAYTETHDGYDYEYVEDGVTEDLSFGAHGSIWSKDHRYISGWDASGEGYHPELLSDRVILTPPYPGNKRGGLWSQNVEKNDEWEAEFEFRATGPERGSGNLQMWFAKNPTHDVGLASIYTVGKFDGLVLTIGQYGGRGSLRAFLNDGSMSFKDHHHVDQMSFASCDFDYRNLGHFSHVLVKQTDWTFEVQIDHVECFKTHKIHLPHGYHFGLTAASAENPDSFEVKSFLVHKLKEGKKIGHADHPDTHDTYQKHHADDHNEWVQEVQEHFHRDAESSAHHDTHHDASHDASHDNHAHTDYHRDDRGWYWTSDDETPKDAPASSFKTDAQRFEDLHNRITTINHQLDILFHDLSMYRTESEHRHYEVKDYIHKYGENQLHMLEKIEELSERTLKDIEGKDYHDHLIGLHQAVSEGNQRLLLNTHSVIKEHSPRFSFFIFVVVASNVMLLVSYIIYKRRKNNRPKKYL